MQRKMQRKYLRCIFRFDMIRYYKLNGSGENDERKKEFRI